MATYLIGDIQGCNRALQQLLQEVRYSPSTDQVYLLGDLVNRGPDSLEVLRYCQTQEGSIHVLLGNHDLHLLACAHGIRTPGGKDTVQPLLQAPDAPQLLAWLARQPLARHLRSAVGQDLLLVHAGVLPSWSLHAVMHYAQEVQAQLSSPQVGIFLQTMYGNHPSQWQDDLEGADRWRVIVNALTRIRFCTPQGAMDFSSSESALQAPAGLLPWFDCPARQTAQTLVAFGHWSTLGLRNTPYLMALDTGCVWGGKLSAMQISMTDFSQRQLYQMACPQMQVPG